MFKLYISKWGKDHKNLTPEMRVMYNKDRADMRKVLEAYKAMDYAKAYKLASNLDTIVRDEIPDMVWDVLEAETNQV